MKYMRMLTLLGLVGGLSSLGCLPTRNEQKPPPVVMESAPPVVTADAVNPENAPEMAKALKKEMEYDARARSKPAPTKAAATPEK